MTTTDQQRKYPAGFTARDIEPGETARLKAEPAPPEGFIGSQLIVAEPHRLWIDEILVAEKDQFIADGGAPALAFGPEAPGSFVTDPTTESQADLVLVVTNRGPDRVTCRAAMMGRVPAG